MNGNNLYPPLSDFILATKKEKSLFLTKVKADNIG